MIMQSYDFYYLFQHYGCNMHAVRRHDQWSRTCSGARSSSVVSSARCTHAVTITLLLNSEGKKMGKTAKGAVWLDPNKTTPFEFYQYWRNVDDADVLKCIRMLTFLPLEEIDKMDSWQGEQLNSQGDPCLPSSRRWYTARRRPIRRRQPLRQCSAAPARACDGGDHEKKQ